MAEPRVDAGVLLDLGDIALCSAIAAASLERLGSRVGSDPRATGVLHTMHEILESVTVSLKMVSSGQLQAGVPFQAEVLRAVVKAMAEREEEIGRAEGLLREVSDQIQEAQEGKLQDIGSLVRQLRRLSSSMGAFGSQLGSSEAQVFACV
jgi:uncharacterized coiled-coil protein SlyX